jgi:hypothetical protein
MAIEREYEGKRKGQVERKKEREKNTIMAKLAGSLG